MWVLGEESSEFSGVFEKTEGPWPNWGFWGRSTALAAKNPEEKYLGI